MATLFAIGVQDDYPPRIEEKVTFEEIDSVSHLFQVPKDTTTPEVIIDPIIEITSLEDIDYIQITPDVLTKLCKNEVCEPEIIKIWEVTPDLYEITRLENIIKEKDELLTVATNDLFICEDARAKLFKQANPNL